MNQALSFTHGPVGRQLFRLALPGVWGLMATLSFNAADAFFVGQLGSDSLAAMSFTFPMSLFVTTLTVGFATGASSVYARLMGQGMKREAKQMAADTLILSLLVSLVVMFWGWRLMRPTFLLLGAEPELLPLIEAYMWPWFWNAPFFALSTVISAIMQASGHTKTAGILMVGTALINIILDPLLIFGWGPVPRMEIAGAAWTTVISRVLLVFACLYFAIGRFRLICLPHLRGSATLRSWRAVLHIGIPAMGNGMIFPIAGTVTLSLVAAYGPDAVAALGVVQRIQPMVLIVFIALSGVLGPFFGQNMAKPYKHRQQQVADIVVRFSIIYTIVIALLLWFSGRYIGSWFSESEEVIRIIAVFLVITPISYGFTGLVITTTSCFNGIGKPLPGVVLSVLQSIGFYVPLALLGQVLWGLEGLFMGTSLANMIAGVISYFWLRQTLITT